MIDLLKFDYRKVMFSDDFKISYNQGPCDIYMKYVAANNIKNTSFEKKRLSADYVNWSV